MLLLRALSALEWNRGATSAGGDWLDVDRIAFDVGLVLLDVVVAAICASVDRPVADLRLASIGSWELLDFPLPDFRIALSSTAACVFGFPWRAPLILARGRI